MTPVERLYRDARELARELRQVYPWRDIADRLDDLLDPSRCCPRCGGDGDCACPSPKRAEERKQAPVIMRVKELEEVHAPSLARIEDVNLRRWATEMIALSIDLPADACRQAVDALRK